MIKQSAKIFFCGLIISFLGSLPLGTLNLITTYVSAANGIGAALIFCYGCIFSEVVFVRLLVIALSWIRKRNVVMKILEWVTIVVLLIFATFSFVAAYKSTPFASALPITIKHPFKAGIIAGLLDPTRIPFWFAWTTVLLVNKVLLPSPSNYNFYTVGIGVGSYLGFIIFIYGGNYLIEIFRANQHFLNWLIGGILLLTAFIQAYRTIRPDMVRPKVN